ncbi:aminotransferase class I/II-fold pyridoxal phosphate-dependent enzyme [Microbacterium paludicola]|uniref:Aromatic amino acid aminotransferase n=1 Tax=Microbacterium paludicola TaxID=300019 RepID=A0A4Y9FSH1_9MICO|nr:histidinol-phosphate transaminase [Microbacterium paludicola]MBF0817115.1 histidinol-phosphate transaminase [Microbacterium paludicola]TFU32177.1 aminotransferase class I/II-fold pyridoxal phosphate-dependent enzyme [Microbacterium paludicola]
MTSEQPVLPRIRPEIAALPPYKQGRSADPSGFKLSSNENPFEPLPGVVEAARAAVDFNRYPDATAANLRAALGEKYGVDPEAVLVGAGSVALLQAFIQAAATAGDEVVYSWRSFEAYPSLALVAGARSVQVPNLPDGRHDLDAMAAAVTERTRVILLCTPNNPTGPIITSAEFHAFVEKVPADVLILLDEAYAEFVRDAEAVDGLGERVFEAHANVVVLRTFSKAYGLAALRVGYAIGHPRVLDAGRSTVTPLSVTATAVAAAVASLAHQAELDERVDEIVARRSALVAGLRQIGWDVPDAQGNFVWLPASEALESTTVATAFDAAGIIVRPFPEGVRISIGEHESLEKVLEIAGALRA